MITLKDIIMKSLNLNLLMAIIVLSVLSGCSSTSNQASNQALMEQQFEIEKLRRAFNQERQDIEQEQREDEIKILPSWVLTPLQADLTGFYAVGIAESKSIFFVMKKAKMQAEFELAKQYRQLLSGSERSFERENTAGELQTQNTVLIDKLIDEVPIIGYDIVKQKIIAVNGMHTAYILLKMPYEQYNKVLQAQKESQIETKISNAFDALQTRLTSRRAEMQQVKTTAHQQHMEKAAQDNQLLIDKLKVARQTEAVTAKAGSTKSAKK